MPDSSKLDIIATDLARNNKARQAMFAKIKAGSTVVIVGAGSSCRLGYPSWNKLIEKLEELVKDYDHLFVSDPDEKSKSIVAYAGKLKKALKAKSKGGSGLRSYYGLINNLYTSTEKGCDEFHRGIVSLPFSSFVTTNYDPVIEHALKMTPIYNLNGRQTDRPIDPWIIPGLQNSSDLDSYFDKLRRGIRVEQVVHLHGKHDIGPSIVLCDDDYKEAYGFGASPAARTRKIYHKANFLQRLLTEHICVFVGFSLTDEHINLMLRSVTADWMRTNDPRHFAIMPLDKHAPDDSIFRARSFQHDYSLQTIFYEWSTNDHNHEALSSLLLELQEYCGTLSAMSSLSMKLAQLEQFNIRMEDWMRLHEN